jgi:trehalose utilization protein
LVFTHIWAPGCHDAIAAIHTAANGTDAKRLWVLDADLGAAFDKLDQLADLSWWGHPFRAEDAAVVALRRRQSMVPRGRQKTRKALRSRAGPSLLPPLVFRRARGLAA